MMLSVESKKITFCEITFRRRMKCNEDENDFIRMLSRVKCQCLTFLTSKASRPLKLDSQAREINSSIPSEFIERIYYLVLKSLIESKLTDGESNLRLHLVLRVMTTQFLR